MRLLAFFAPTISPLSLSLCVSISPSLSLSRQENGPKGVSPDQKLYFYPQWPRVDSRAATLGLTLGGRERQSGEVQWEPGPDSLRLALPL